MLEVVAATIMVVFGVGFAAVLIYDRVRKQRTQRLLSSRPPV